VATASREQPDTSNGVNETTPVAGLQLPYALLRFGWKRRQSTYCDASDTWVACAKEVWQREEDVVENWKDEVRNLLTLLSPQWRLRYRSG